VAPLVTERGWEELRDTLATEFGDDLAQQAILELLEAQAQGKPVANPLHWCRKCARRRKINEKSRNRLDLTEDTHKLFEKSLLPGLHQQASQLYLLMAGEGLGDRPNRDGLSMASAAVRKRRSRRKLRDAKAAA